MVDDTPRNLQLLLEILKRSGCRVRPATSGEVALKAARRDAPDLILLDINMPGLNGYEVCEQLKLDPATRDIPVIFISGLDGVLDKVRAFSVGGVDYLTKPVEAEEVLARVRTHLRLREKERELAEHVVRLEELERLRENLVQMAAHDMRSPLSVISMSLDMLRPADTAEPNELSLLHRNAQQATGMLARMVEQFLAVSRLESHSLPVVKTEADLTQTVAEVVAGLDLLIGQRQVLQHLPASCCLPYDAHLIERVLGNLITNALKYTPSKSPITVAIEPQPGMMRVAVTDQGCGIPEEYHERIFEKYGQLEVRQRFVGSGLGLTFCRLAVEAHGGRIGVQSKVGQGSTFWFTLPTGAAAVPAAPAEPASGCSG